MRLSTECLLSFLGEGCFYCLEPVCNTWNIVCENTSKNPEFVILANVIFGFKSNLRVYVLNALRNRPSRYCKKLNTVHIMAFLLIRTKVTRRFL